jgi:hypothetical protein
MIDQAAAFSVFSRWRDEMTTLRVDTELGVIAFSLECTLMRVEERLLGLLLANCGFIEFIFDDTWGFEIMSLDSLRVDLEKRAGDSPLKDRRYEYNEGIVAVRLGTSDSATTCAGPGVSSEGPTLVGRP